ncbi:MAG: hypothetical protein KKC37_06865, partial [Proteobacteria bacterium]|nr:hypothetical protein [Pseudomonadota bacterium]
PRPDLTVKPRPVDPGPKTSPPPPPPPRPPSGPRLAHSGHGAPFLGRWRYTVLRPRDKAIVWEGRLVVRPGPGRTILIRFAGQKPFPAQVAGQGLVRFVTPSGARVEWTKHPLVPVFVGTYRYPDGRSGLVRGERPD